ncbi:MAG: DNA-binding domain-containing protein [Holophaga sp.]
MTAPEPLEALQRRMAEAVMAPLTSRWGMARRRDGRRLDQEAAQWVEPNDRLSPFQRLEIYNRQYWFRLLDCLWDDFPGLRSLLGRVRFTALCRAYLADCPPRSFALNRLGDRLVPWLDEQARWDPLVVDMARLEWAHIEAFDAPEAEPLAAARLGAVDADTRLALQPHLRLLCLGYPVDDLLAAQRDAPCDGGAGNHAMAARRRRTARRAAALPPGEVHLAVHRHDCSVYYKRLAPEACRILAAIQAGATLGAALEAGFQASTMPESERPDFLARSFHDWASLGWFARTSRSDAHA